jgi:hypothetical protein
MRSNAVLVWLTFGGQLWPQKWFVEPDGKVVGVSPSVEPAARHDLSVDECNMTLAELAKRYPAPERTA